MSNRSQNPAGLLILLAALFIGATTMAADIAARCADRAAIERVYHGHRLGEQPPFAEMMPPATLENLVRQDLRKEAALQKSYGVAITPTLLAAEVQRIDTTTRAPAMLAEIKAALGQEADRFARSMAKPILVERLLRERFDSDDSLHSARRREIESVRADLLTARTSGASVAELLARLQRSQSNAVVETTWQLGVRPGATNASGPDELAIMQRFGSGARLLSPAGTGQGSELYFQDLPPELQRVLRVQLRQAGDISAVIETPGGFLLYVTTEKSDALLSVAGLSLPKRSYEQWLAEQNETNP